MTVALDMEDDPEFARPRQAEIVGIFLDSAKRPLKACLASRTIYLGCRLDIDVTKYMKRDDDVERDT